MPELTHETVPCPECENTSWKVWINHGIMKLQCETCDFQCDPKHLERDLLS